MSLVRQRFSRGYLAEGVAIGLRVLACFVIGFSISAFTGWAHKAIAQRSAHKAQPVEVASKQPLPAARNLENSLSVTPLTGEAEPAVQRPTTTPTAAEKAEPSHSRAAAQPESVGTKRPRGAPNELPVRSTARPATIPKPAVGRQRLAAAASAPTPATIPAAARVASAPRTTTSQSVVPNPVFYVDLGPAQDPDAPKPAQSETAADSGPPVSYRNGQLTINVKNVTLAAVLQMVAQKTKAKIDIPPDNGMERIAVHAGPGSPDEVLAEVLKGSPFNFVIVHSTQRPDELQQVLLTVRGPGEQAVARSAERAEAEPPKQGLPKELLEKLFSRKRPPDEVTSPPDQTPPASEPPPPEGQTSPETVEQMMKDKANEIRQSADQR